MNKRTNVQELDIQYTLKITHKPGKLGNLLSSLGDVGALVGDIVTLYVGKSYATRKITFSLYDQEHAQQIENLIENSGVAKVLKQEDMVYQYHQKGKIHSGRKKDVLTLSELRYIYTPGVARVCQKIHEDTRFAQEYTSIGNTVGIFTNGTRVLGLGDIGPEASMPVMEGKAVIYDQFVGLSAVPVLIDTKDPEEFVDTVVRVAPTFGGIHLEDIRVPDCFYIEDELKKRLKKPVMHDDQHGTGTVTLAAVMTIIRDLKLNSNNIAIAQIGLGAAGFGIGSLLVDWGMDVIGVDPSELAQKRFIQHGGKIDSLENAIQKAKIIITTTGVVGLIKPKMIQKGQCILSLSNPIPEISAQEALGAGAIFYADGKTINNALAYPGLFRAALEKNTLSICSKMKIKTAEVLSQYADDGELVPSPFHPSIHKVIIDELMKF